MVRRLFTYAPVGAGRWEQLLGQLVEAGAPFAGRMADLLDELVARWRAGSSRCEPGRPVTGTCGPTMSCHQLAAEYVSSTGTTAAPPIQARSSDVYFSSSVAETLASPVH